MLGKVNVNSEQLVLDEQIEVEFSEVSHIVDLKFTRNQYIKLMNICSQYDAAVLSVMEGSYTPLEDIDAEFVEKTADFIDLSFITGEDEIKLKANTLISIQKKLLQITPK